MQDQNSKKAIAAALRGDHEAIRGDEAATPPPGTEDEAVDSAFEQKPATSEGDRKIRAVGPAPGVQPVMTGATNPDRPASAFGTARLARWGIGVIVAVLALWLLLGLFG